MGHFNQDYLFEKSLEEGIWEVGVGRVFASGDNANNKVDWDQLYIFDEDKNFPSHPSNFLLSPAGKLIVEALVEAVDSYSPDLLMGVPSGGQRYAKSVARVLGIEVALLKKVPSLEPGQKKFDYQTSHSQDLVEQSRRLAIIEDVTNKNTSLGGVLRVPGVSEKAVLLQAIQRRDDGTNESELPLQVNWLIDAWPMPNIMTRDDPTYQRWGHLAVGVLNL